MVSHGGFGDGARRPDGASRALANALRRPHLRVGAPLRWPRSEAVSMGVQIGGGALAVPNRAQGLRHRFPAGSVMASKVRVVHPPSSLFNANYRKSLNYD